MGWTKLTQATPIDTLFHHIPEFLSRLVVINCPLTRGNTHSGGVCVRAWGGGGKLRKLHLGFICVVQTGSARGLGGCGEVRQLIDQTASRLLIYSDRKSINSFSLISPPLLSCCSSLSDWLTSLFSSPFVTYANTFGGGVKGNSALVHMYSFKLPVCHSLFGVHVSWCLLSPPLLSSSSLIIDYLHVPQCPSVASLDAT